MAADQKARSPSPTNYREDSLASFRDSEANREYSVSIDRLSLPETGSQITSLNKSAVTAVTDPR